ncbi:HIT family protein [Hyphomonas johnsonii]|uniref:Histidine triad family protein n=1 Tax=Hyphomonas johnsonii MHS-2 TaxID=1280950 RepID=A0A059FUD2_9PROT|nr:HIT family protein [Hyphomonas johnsonii]KCZ94023.1 histidine triad family protein [Hyphomonas johnsonii MHS-2]
MTLHAPYDPDNVFAKILRDEMPAVKVYEDDTSLAFMDVFPQSKGHTLVVPKHVTARNFLDMPPEKLGAYMLIVQKVATAVEAAFKPDGLIISQFNGAPAGQTVYHLHFHVLPRWENVPLVRHGTAGMADMGELEELAAKIRAKL